MAAPVAPTGAKPTADASSKDALVKPAALTTPVTKGAF
jgi:hypothetical protein